MKNNQPKYSYELYISAPVGRVWKGIAYVADGNVKVVDGEILEVEPEKRLVMTWRAHWDEAVSKDPASRVTYELSPAGPSTTKLRAVHDDFESENATYRGSAEGWPVILSSLKTLLETGKPLQMKGANA